MINGEFLRGGLKSYSFLFVLRILYNRHLLKHDLNPEIIIDIFYTFGLNKPEPQESIQEEDWIKNITILENFIKN